MLLLHVMHGPVVHMRHFLIYLLIRSIGIFEIVSILATSLICFYRTSRASSLDREHLFIIMFLFPIGR